MIQEAGRGIMNKIPRKPIATTAAASLPPSYDILDDLIDDYLEPSPELVKTTSAVEVVGQPHVVSKSLVLDSPSPVLRGRKSTPALISKSSGLSVVSTSPAPNALVSSGPRWKTILDETVYFAGGLISHPFESTKHYSILRHSSALVYYRGPSTNVTISIFGDSALPPDRSFWIQRKGFSGNIGMAASAFMRTTSNWIDVTPSAEALPSTVPESDERAWQRDIKKFLKKAAKDKRLSKHVVRETCVLRIPASAADGYLRVVMCSGESSKKSLCPSPTFRLASTSSDVSVLRGASLTTLPLEIGLKAASVVGNQYVQRVVGPAQTVIQSRMESMQPSFIKNHAGTLAVAQTGIQEQFSNLGGNFDAARDVSYSPFHEDALDEPPDIIGRDSGPEKPFPLAFHGKVVPGTGQSRNQIGTPTANLCNVAEDMLLRLNGIYIGWAKIEQVKSDGPLDGWHEAIITIAPSPYAPPSVVPLKIATVHILRDFGASTTFFNAKLRVMVMASLRSAPKAAYSQLLTDRLVAITRDKEIAIASLSRERWQPDVCLDILTSEKSQRTMTDRYIGFRSEMQRRVDSLPVHRAGIRTDRADAKDEAYGQGGFYIRR